MCTFVSNPEMPFATVTTAAPHGAKMEAPTPITYQFVR